MGSIRRRTGCQLDLDTSGIRMNGRGYFKVDVMVVVTPDDSGDVTIKLQQDGADVPGAVATVQGTAATATIITIPAVVRQRSFDAGYLNVYYEGTSATINNISFIIERV